MMRRGAIVLAVFVMLAGYPAIPADVVQFRSQTANPVVKQDKKQEKSAASKSCRLTGVSDKHLQEVIDATGKLPAPLAVDAMIHIADKVASQCPGLTKDLLQRAFDQAGTVEPATAFKFAIGKGLQTDSRLFFAKKTYDLAMDRLSLQSRAVMAMAPVDGKKALQLFHQIASPRPAAATCASGFAPDVSIYYDALAKILALLKSQKPHNDAEAQAPFLLLQEVINNTTSPVQLAPMAKVLDKADLSPAELSTVLSMLAAAIDNFPVDDASFYYWKSYPSVKAKDQLAQLATNKEISSAGFRRSFDVYLDRSLNGPHCEGDDPKDVKELITLYRSFIHAPGATDAGPDPLHAPDTLPPIEPGPDAGDYWETPKGKALLLDAKHLNFDDNWQPFTDADFKTPEWQDRVRHLLDDMEDWNPSDEASPADYYHEIEALIFRVLSRLPPGNLYDQVLALWIKTFTESSLQWDNPGEWYIGVSDFLRFSRTNMDKPAPAAIAGLKNSSRPCLSSLGIITEFLQ